MILWICYYCCPHLILSIVGMLYGETLMLNVTLNANEFNFFEEIFFLCVLGRNRFQK